MSGVLLLKFLHVVSVGFFGGGLLAMMLAQTFLQRSHDEGERRQLAQLVSRMARVLIVPLIAVGFVAGLVLMFWMYGSFGMGKVMSCTPVYVHMMLGLGILALGFAQVWKGKTRKFAAALAENQPLAQARKHVTVGWIFASLALLVTLVAFAVGTFKTPNPARTRCVAPSAAVSVLAPSVFQA